MIKLKILTQTEDGRSILFYPSDSRYPSVNVGFDLREGESAADYYDEASERIESVLREKMGDQFEIYEPTAEEIGLQRAAMVPKIMAGWFAYNNQKLESGEWSVEDFTTFMPLALDIAALLHTYAFGATKAAIMAFDHKLATPEAKADYIKIMEEAERG